MSAKQTPNAQTRRAFLLAGGGITVAALLAYHNCFSAPFVFDDIPAIVDNPSIRRLGRLGEVLWPHLDGGLTVSGRPLVNFSLAVNHALGGQEVWGYHAVNLLIHVLAGLVLFGIIRRTLLQPALAGRFGLVALPLAAVTAAIWTVHPLQTESVTYIVQRAESLMGLCYLLTLYAFIRGTAAVRPHRWLALSFIACLLGMASKEVMVSAPLIVWLYDRTFVAGNFAEAWRRRWGYYLALAGTWILLVFLVAGTTGRGGTAGFATTITPWNYLLTQCGAIIHYLRLAIWPHPLIFDYGTATVEGLAEVWPQALGLLALAGATVWALVRRPVWGFLGASFFALLAPSSSFVPVASQTMAEHRFYLPLALATVLVVVGLERWLGRWAWAACAVCGLSGVWLTMQRNEDYRSDAVLWADTVAKCPANARAHNNLGKAVFTLGRVTEAMEQYREAIRLQPAAPEPHYNLGLVLARQGLPADAIKEYEEALRLQPDYPEALNNLGNTLLATGRSAEAVAHYEKAVRLKPDYVEAHSNLSNAFLETGRVPEAIREGEEAVARAPANADAHFNLGNAFARAARFAEARSEYEAALRLRPDYADVANNLGNILVELDRLPEAITAYERALQLDPGYADSRHNLTQVLIHLGRPADAVALYERLQRQRPDDPDVRAELVRLREMARP